MLLIRMFKYRQRNNRQQQRHVYIYTQCNILVVEYKSVFLLGAWMIAVVSFLRYK